jgi:chemotaxis protein histidine kinase CheA
MKMKWYRKKFWAWFFVVFCFPIGLILMYYFHRDWLMKKNSALILAAVILASCLMSILATNDEDLSTDTKITDITTEKTEEITTIITTEEDETEPETEEVTNTEIVTQAPKQETPKTNPPANNSPATNSPATNSPATNSPATNSPATNPPATNPPAPATETPKNSKTVYVTPTGKKYHYDGTCNGGTYSPSTLDDAKSKGLTACNKCVN